MKKDHYKSKSWLYKRYTVDGKTIQSIADECGVTHATIYNWLVRFDLLRNPRKWAKK
jgi:transposase